MSVKDTGHMQTLENSGKKTLAERIAGLSPEQRAVYELKSRELQKKAASPRFPGCRGAGHGLRQRTRQRCGSSSSLSPLPRRTTSEMVFA